MTAADFGGCPSIRTKALSRHTHRGRRVSAACFAMCGKGQSLSLIATSSLGGFFERPTNHRFGHQQQTMMLLCEHPSWRGVRECSIRSSVCLLPARATFEFRCFRLKAASCCRRAKFSRRRPRREYRSPITNATKSASKVRMGHS